MKIATLGLVGTTAFGTSIATMFGFACNPIVKVDVQCDKLCMSAPGPTLPGTEAEVGQLDSGVTEIDAAEVESLIVDAALPATADVDAVEWLSVLEFNQVLKQMPQGSAADQTKVLLTAISLISSDDLSFIDTVDVSMSRVHTPPVGAQDGAAVVSGTSPAVCASNGVSLWVAHFQHNGETHSRTALPLGLLVPDLNLFDCMKDDPTEFHVRMSFRPGQRPAKDTPLVLSPCIRSETHLSIP